MFPKKKRYNKRHAYIRVHTENFNSKHVPGYGSQHHNKRDDKHEVYEVAWYAQGKYRIKNIIHLEILN